MEDGGMEILKLTVFTMVMNDLLQLDCIGVSLAEMPVDFSFVDTTARQIVALAPVKHHKSFTMCYHLIKCR